MTFTCNQLQQIMPLAQYRAPVFYPFLLQYTEDFAITTLKRRAMFLAQIAHESGQLKYTRELGNTEYFDKYDTGSIAKNLGNTPAKDGDGARYRGRGLIQITGHDNYAELQYDLKVDVIDHPELLEQPDLATRSACWWWKKHGCNELADSGDIRAVTRKINGGYNGLTQRQQFYNKALLVLGKVDFSNVESGSESTAPKA